MDLKQKTILITGGSHGIGRALSESLVHEGVYLILVARSEDRLKKFVTQYGKQHRYFVCDLSDSEQILKLTESVRKENSSLDILINVAGIGIYKNLEDTLLSDWQTSFATNVTAPYFLTQGLLPLLQKTKDSFVFNIGSGAGNIPMRGRSMYCATKYALHGWTLSLAEEFKDTFPRFFLITLGSTLTNFSGKSVEEKKKEQAAGRAYFPVEWVADKLVEIIKNDNRETETTLFPGDYGFGTWKKP